MKTRVLSLVLALIMVASLTAVFTVSSSADDDPAFTVSVGTAYAAPGTTAQVEIFVSAKGLAEDFYLRNWQFTFEGLALSGDADFAPYVSGGQAFGIENLNDNFALNSAAAGQNCGTAAQMSAFGGWKIATIGFAVPDDAVVGSTLPLTISLVKALSCETAPEVDVIDAGKTGATATVTAGKVVVVAANAADAAAYEGTGESYVIPKVNEDGYVTNVPALSGEFDILTIPASVTESFKVKRNVYKLDDVTALNGVVVKSIDEVPDLFDAILNIAEGVVPVYYHKSTQGVAEDSTAAVLQGLVDDGEDLEAINLLQVYADAITTEKGVAFVAGVAVPDTDYAGGLTLSIKIGEKSWEVTKRQVYTTLTGVATASESVAAASELTYTEGITYLTGAVIKGIPAGSYTAEITLYARTADALGSPVGVCSDTATIDFTVA